ncbi:MAG TPA: hypothetical protein VFL97_01845 [Nitrococcus sp.]|nr:hypothetical protein [Nitrococcus sp.]
MAGDLVEPFGIPDVFVSGLAEVEDVGGGCMRFVFYARHDGERQVVAKLVAPIDAVPPAVMMAAKAVGWCLAKDRVCAALVN